jgi:hypothetical protein
MAEAVRRLRLRTTPDLPDDPDMDHFRKAIEAMPGTLAYSLCDENYEFTDYEFTIAVKRVIFIQ